MSKMNNLPLRLKTISAHHQFMGLPDPQHPLVSVIKFENMKRPPDDAPRSIITDFYSIALKRNYSRKMKYGQQEYDFTAGIMAFVAPGQLLSFDINEDFNHAGYLLSVHPDFLWNTPLARTIKQYEYFSYSINEALHLSQKEESTVISLIQNIEQEYQSPIDTFSHSVILAQLELLLVYGERFYHRQFITRKNANHRILTRLEDLLNTYFNSHSLAEKGLPTVQHIATSLHLSPTYLSTLLKVLTGQSTQQHIHDKLIEKAKEKLSTTELSVSEIAYELGFEHAQSFSKLFKSKTNLSPLEFRQSFN
jgi:AraC-like DNA-binding protein